MQLFTYGFVMSGGPNFNPLAGNEYLTEIRNELAQLLAKQDRAGASAGY